LEGSTSQTVPSSVVKAQSGKYSTGWNREYWWETVAVGVGGAGVGEAGRRVAVAVGARLVGVGGSGGTGVQAGVSAGATVGLSVGTTVAVAVFSGVGLHGSVGVAEGLGVLVGVGVTEEEGARMDRSGQVQPMVIADVKSAPAIAIPRCLMLLRVSMGEPW